MDRSASRGELVLVVLFATSGCVHFVRPRPFEQIVPHRLPAKRALVYLSGVAELACAAGLLVPSTRRAAGLGSAGLLLAVFPANVQMAVDIHKSGGRLARGLALVRLPLQVPLVRTAWHVWSHPHHPKDPTVESL